MRTRAMERRLRSVEELPTDRASSVLQLASGEVDPVDETAETSIEAPNDPPVV